MTTFRQNATGALNVIVICLAFVLVAFGLREIADGRLGSGAFVIFIGFAAIWGVGGKLLKTWTGFQPGRHYLLGAIVVFGGFGSLALKDAVTAGDLVGATVNGLVAAILIPGAALSFYGWLKGPSRSAR